MSYKNIEINSTQYNSRHTAKQSQFYIGYSSVNSETAAVRLYDFDLIKQDILNQFNTKKGERVMNPEFGTVIWDIIFEPFTEEVKQAISDDVSRICNSDPRAVPIQIDINEQEYGMILEITLQYTGTDQTDTMKISFDRELGLTSQ